MDVFAAGPVARELSSAFDHYWNSDVVYPVASIAYSAQSDASLRDNFERETAKAVPPRASEIPADGRPEHPESGEPEQLSPELVGMLDLSFELAPRRLSPLLLACSRALFDPLT